MTEDRKPEELDRSASGDGAPRTPEPHANQPAPDAPGAGAPDASDAAAPGTAASADAAPEGAAAGGAGGDPGAPPGGPDDGGPEPAVVPDADAAVQADPQDGDDQEQGEGQLREMGLLDHLEELRIRLTRVAIAVVVGACVSYAFAEHLYRFIIDPLIPFVSGGHLIYTSPAEGFITYIKLAAVAGIFLTSPYSFYQMWAFIAPGLYKEEKRYIAPLAFVSALLFVGGALFSYYKVTPLAYEFFSSFDNEFMVMLPSVKESLSMGLKLLFAFGIAFELPLAIFFLARLGVVSAAGLRRSRKYAILGAFIVGALLTPPDPASQSLMAIPLIMLYEVGIWLAHFFGKKPAPSEEEEQAAA